MNKNLWLLILSQIFAFTAAPVTVFLSGIIGSQFSPIKFLATLPMALSIVGIAIFAMFAAKICLLYTSPSPRDRQKSRMPSSA